MTVTNDTTPAAERHGRPPRPGAAEACGDRAGRSGRGPARHDDRQRRDRHARTRSPRGPVHYPMGLDRLPVGARVGDPAHGLVGGPLRKQADVDALARAIPRRLGALRLRLVDWKPDRVPRRAGHRRRPAAPANADDPRSGGGAAAAGQVDRRHCRPGACGPDRGPGDRRPDTQQRKLALDLLHQRPRLRDRAAARVAVHARPASTRRASAGPPRAGTALSRARGDRLRLLRGRGRRRLRRRSGDSSR